MAEVDRESYFDLPVSDQADLLQSLAPVMGRRAEILEKDIWLCQVLDILFQLPCRKPMAFKGGTSLSKVYQARIGDRPRFSVAAPVHRLAAAIRT